MSRNKVSILEVIRYMRAYEKDRGIGYPLLDSIYKNLKDGTITADEAMQSVREFRILDSFQMRRKEERKQAWMREMVELKRRSNPEIAPLPKGTPQHDYPKAVQTLLAEPEIAKKYTTFWIKNEEGLAIYVRTDNEKAMTLHAEKIFDIIMTDYIKEINEAAEKKEVDTHRLVIGPNQKDWKKRYRHEDFLLYLRIMLVITSIFIVTAVSLLLGGK